ncbi:MAG: hypothetical protein AAGI11_20745 [Pseudomonadota bacterium]
MRYSLLLLALLGLCAPLSTLAEEALEDLPQAAVQASSLPHHPWADMLARDKAYTEADRAALEQLQRAYAAGQAQPRLSADTVSDALEQLDRPQAEGLSPTEQLFRWLREWLGGRESADTSWLDDISIPETVGEYTLYTLLVLILLLAIFVVIREVRLSLHPKRDVAQASWARTAGGEAENLPPDFDSLADVSPAQRAILLFQIIVARLGLAGLIEARRSLTHREVVDATAHLGQAQTIEAISSAAEGALFGGRAPDDTDADALIDAGRKLCAGLDGAASS